MKPYILKKNLQSPILITCEHASSRIPRAFGTLGLTREQVAGAKDLYDPGSEALARMLAQQLGSSLLMASLSRLVIDYNRRLDMHGVAQNAYHAPALKTQLLTEIDGQELLVPIPANMQRSRILERQRYRSFVTPYQTAGTALAFELAARHGRCVVVSVHSFYPVYAGQERSVNIDVLYDVSVAAGKVFARQVRRHTAVRVAENKPWGLRDVDGGVFNQLQRTPQIVLVGVDINNAQLSTMRGVKNIAQTLTEALRRLVGTEG